MKIEMRRKCLVCFMLPAVLALAMTPCCGAGESGKETKSLNKINEQIKSFRAGGEFTGNTDEFIVDGRPDTASLREFAAALDREEEPVREQICRLLVGLGMKIDPLFASGGGLIHDRTIISVLVGKGISRPTPTRDFCLTRLQLAVPGPILREYGKQLAENLMAWPDATLLLVIAKAKSPETKKAVDDLMKIPGWAKERETRIAAAALGDAEMEREFIKSFLETSEPGEKADRATALGRIGTENALEALAREMRTDLVIEMTGVSRRSVRIFIIAALSYNYPESTFLYDNAVGSDEDYARIERFCEETFGVEYTKERPPFLWIEGYPSEPPSP